MSLLSFFAQKIMFVSPQINRSVFDLFLFRSSNN